MGIGLVGLGAVLLVVGAAASLRERQRRRGQGLTGTVTGIRTDEERRVIAYVEFRDAKGEKQKLEWRPLARPSLGQSVRIAHDETGGGATSLSVAESDVSYALLWLVLGGALLMAGLIWPD